MNDPSPRRPAIADGSTPRDRGDRYDLQARYLDLTRIELPAAARRHGWPIHADHCFMRLALDTLFDGCWYDHLDRRLRAYKQLNDNQLVEVVALCERMLQEGEPLIRRLNSQSLAYRGTR